MKLKELVWACFCLYLFFVGLGIRYYDDYRLAYGMSDVDRYNAWLDGEPLSGKVYYVHGFVLWLLSLVPNRNYTLNYIIPFVVWLVLPFSLFRFYNTLSKDKEDNISRVVFFIFGTFTLLFFQYTALWAELLAFVFFIWALSWRGVWGIIFAVLSVLAHPMMAGIWFLYVLAYLWDRGAILVFISLALAGAGCVYVSGAYTILTFFSDYTGNEAGLYMMFYVYTCPLLIMFAVMSRTKTRLESFIFLLFVVTPFIQIGRGLPFAHIFLAYYALDGYHQLREHLGQLFYPFTFALVFLWFEYFLGFIQGNMVKELVLRGL